MQSELSLRLPQWLIEKLGGMQGSILPTNEARMAFAIELLREQVERRTGGPFAALVVEQETGRLISAGVNLVTESLDPSAHAEIVAVRLATAARSNYQLGGTTPLQLVTTGQPCAMCFGMVVWSGVQSLLIGATVSDAEQIAGFDEGPIHPTWREELAKRGISVTEGVMAAEVQTLYRRYVELGGIAYNGERSA